jgi:endonuclease/exonuclease/phosphatase (EEP) superfamily protein YafD
MGGRVSLSAFSTPGTLQTGISVVSCNVNHFGPDFESVLREITSFSPDVVALQETTGDAHLLPQYFPGWHVIAEDQYWIGSRYPLRRLGLCDSKIFRHATALSVRVDAPQGPFILNDVHQTTPRFGFLKVSWDSVRDGTGPQAVESDTKRRLAEALQLRAYVENNSLADNGQPLPVVVVGDFNTPSVSHLYRAAWGDFTNAFGAAGLGFGYTALCGRHEFRFVDIPWVRIDHILTDDRWTVTACEVGRGNGSDHRPIRAVLSRQE